MAKIDPRFKRRLESAPTERVGVIVKVSDDPRDRMSDVMGCGLTIHHTYSLIKALAASGLGASVLALADEPWVDKIEPDEEVRTMN